MKYKKFHSPKLITLIVVVIAGWQSVPLSAQETRTRALEEIVVTATKRAEDIQDVAVAVSVFSADRILEAHILTLEDLQFIAPTITIGTDFGTAQLFMRGLGQNSILNNIDPSVGLYVDGAVINAPAAQLFAMFDLERVEVLRGPQGTLFGRNTTGGAINLITAKPTEEFEGYARVSVGDYSLAQTEGALSGSLSGNRVLGRFAWKTSRRDGFGNNEFTGGEIDDQDQLMYRASVQFNVSDRTNFLLTGEYGHQDDRAFAFKFQEESFPVTNPASGRGGFATGGPRNVSLEFDPSNQRETWSITGTFDFQLNDRVLIRSITNYRDLDVDQRLDIDLSSNPGFAVTQQLHQREQFSEELQLHYNGDFMGARLDAIAGVFFYSEDAFFANRIGAFPDRGIERTLSDGSISTDPRVKLLSNGDTDSTSFFWNTRFSFTNNLALKLGGRWTSDDRKVVNVNQVFAGPAEPRNLRFPPGFDESKNFDDYTNEIGFEWHPAAASDMMVYYSYSEGFKSGTAPGGTTEVGTDPSFPGFVEPENITNHEIGLKSVWLDGSLRTNIAAFSYDIDGIQLQIALQDPVAGFVTRFSNFTDQSAKGAEFEVDWIATDRLRLSGAIAWLDAEFDNLVGEDPLNPGTQGDFAGNQPRRSPEITANAHIAYDFPSANNGLFTFSMDGTYKDDHYFDEFNNARMFQESYFVYDARLRYVAADERWSAEVWGKNLSDELIKGENRALATGRVIGRTFLDPRTWGVTFGINF